ncbi:MAG TPA: EAL domain-containing protein, partial [Wenzhouxiangellaceae bacterium]|nr:EAL domain-containing protein [Wenzhouxiangellaceae bacterium]
ELRRGLSEGQFEMYFQPIVAVRDARVVGFEALLRWRHPERGVLPPAAFLDEAASIGVLDALESFALESALEQLSAWSRQGKSRFKVAVNVSARRFQHDDLVEKVVDACSRFEVAPDRLNLEITENTALRDLPHAARQINALQKVGVNVALDDFGTGYSSLANLIKLPVDSIKLDREFLAGMLNNSRQRGLVAAMIGLGHRLGLEVVAEGVELSAQLEFLAAHDCDLAQGYLLQRPDVPTACRFELMPLPG